MRSTCLTVASLVVAAGLMVPASHARATITNWTNPVGGSAALAGNWSAGVPGPLDIAKLIQPGRCVT